MNVVVRRWMLAGLAVAGLLLALVGAAQVWLGSDDFHRRAELLAQDALGVPVRLGTIRLDLLPVPGLALEAVRIETQPAATIERLELRAALGALLGGRLVLSALQVQRADLSQAAVDAWMAQRSRKPAAPPADEPAGAPSPWPRRVQIEALTWRPATGTPLTLDADARLADDGLPDSLEVQLRSGPWQGAELALARRQLDWEVRARLAGGTVRGTLTLDRLPAATVPVRLTGRLVTEGVDVARLSRQRLSGRLGATTTLDLRTGTSGLLLDALQTQSQFAVRDAVVHGVDLARAVKTVGLNRGGETRLDTLAGQVATRGRAVQLSNLVASSGLLTASGQVAISPSQALRGRVQVHLGPAAVGQAVGVPLVVGGTTDNPELTLTRGALLGAAIGTMVMPGVGTGAGASVGERIGNSLQGLFGK